MTQTISPTATPKNLAPKARTVPSDLAQVFTIAKYDLLKHFRARRMIGMVAIVTIVIVLAALLIGFGDGEKGSVNDIVRRYSGFTTILIILCATLFGGDAIVSEFQGRTGYLLFPNPVRRSSILLGKYLSACMVTIVMLVAYYAGALVVGLAFGDGSPAIRIVYSLGLAILYGMSAMAVAFMISSFMRGATGSLILTFAMFLFIFSIIESLIGGFGRVDPWWLLSYAGNTSYLAMDDPYPVSHMEYIGDYEIYVPVPQIWISVGVMVLWMMAALMLSYLFFRYREMSS